MENKLQSLNAVVDDAKQKQFGNVQVRAWLLNVKVAALDVEDVLDEIQCEQHSRRQVEAESESQSCTCKVPNFFKSSSVSSFNKEINSSMKKVLGDLEDLVSKMNSLPLKKASDDGVGSGSGSKVQQKSQSTSLVVESDIYGRDDDKRKIVDWLTSDTDKKLSILSIVGMGGLGKTTLAQLVYNDARIESKFDIKAWVCVSEEFNVLNVSRAILDTFTKSTENSDQLQIVHTKLKDELRGNRFLLVLDDVWNESWSKWEAVQNVLVCGAQGSRILVTTRSEKVASSMRSEQHHLQQLQEDYCWQLLAKHAFHDGNPQPNPECNEIGMKIVEKCKGLPLALKTMGSLLYKKSSVSEWESVLQSQIWEFSEERSDIVPALALSYHHLPPHLKTCFAYCGLFPKDCEFEKECLIQLWMAENFLHCHQCIKSPEEVGQQYFNDLLSRSFFQQSSNVWGTCFVMHDLLNDLAKYVSGEICIRLGVDKAKGISKSTRHFSFATNHAEYFDGFESLQDAGLRTFVPTDSITNSGNCTSWHCMMSIHELISKFKLLRILSLRGCSDLIEVPDSISNLTHLRSLDLSFTDVNKLPDSTCSLSNLQILKLNSCTCLKELPLNLHELTSLRRLEIMYTGLRKVPPRLGKLKNLQVLISSFVVDKSSEFTTQQLGEFNLHGSLLITELQNIENPLHALAMSLKNKIHLVELELRWDRDKNPDDSEKKRDENVIENLQPSEHLEMLSICSYGGTKFPSWLSDNSLRNVVSLKLDSCQSCLRLPCLGDLQFLKDLEITGLDGKVGIGADFHGCSSPSFRSLEKLKFHCMRGWEKWECQDVTDAFPRLQHLSLEDCPKLKGRLPVQLVQLKTLKICHCKHLVDGSLYTHGKRFSISSPIMEAWLLEGIGHIISSTSLQHLEVYYFPNINIPMSGCYDSLDSLTICEGCDSLVNFLLDSFPTLGKLDLIWCPNLQRISQEHTHNHLKSLRISNCLQLESLPERMQTLLPSLEKLEIEDCPKVESFPEGGLPSNLRSLSLYNCSKLIASAEMALGANLSLKTLHIGEMDGESFLGEDLLPLSLTYLCIHDCASLQCLPEGLCRLSCLQELDLLRCPSLECLPEGFCQLSSLKELVFKSCYSLKCLPEGLCHLSSLKELVFEDCNSLKCLPEGLFHLSSLQKLVLVGCPKLQCLPEKGLPKSITTLNIWDCPLLHQRCQEPDGEDWTKIAFIQNLDISLF